MADLAWDLATVAVALALGHIVLVGYYVGRALEAGVLDQLQRLLGWAAGLRAVIKPWLELRRPYVVAEVRPERGNAWTLTLRPEGHAGMTFHPGQFAWLTLRSSPFADREHPFSFSSSAEQPERLGFTIRELGDFTRQIGQVRPGERAPATAPVAFTTDRHDHEAGFTYIAGGVGITPIMSILRAGRVRRRHPVRQPAGGRGKHPLWPGPGCHRRGCLAPTGKTGFTDIALVQIGDDGQEEFLHKAAEPLLAKLRDAVN